MKTIKQILAEKTKPLTVVSPDDTVLFAARLMSERDVGAALVLENGKLVGMFTERDCLQKMVAAGRDPATTKLREVMSVKVRYAKPNLDVSEGLALMTERFFRHLPVLDDDQKLLGVVSIGDLVKAKISEQEFIIEQLEHYITS